MEKDLQKRPIRHPTGRAECPNPTRPPAIGSSRQSTSQILVSFAGFSTFIGFFLQFLEQHTLVGLFVEHCKYDSLTIYIYIFIYLYIFRFRSLRISRSLLQVYTHLWVFFVETYYIFHILGLFTVFFLRIYLILAAYISISHTPSGHLQQSQHRTRQNETYTYEKRPIYISKETYKITHKQDAPNFPHPVGLTETAPAPHRVKKRPTCTKGDLHIYIYKETYKRDPCTRRSESPPYHQATSDRFSTHTSKRDNAQQSVVQIPLFHISFHKSISFSLGSYMQVSFS